MTDQPTTKPRRRRRPTPARVREILEIQKDIDRVHGFVEKVGGPPFSLVVEHLRQASATAQGVVAELLGGS